MMWLRQMAQLSTTISRGTHAQHVPTLGQNTCSRLETATSALESSPSPTPTLVFTARHLAQRGVRRSSSSGRDRGPATAHTQTRTPSPQRDGIPLLELELLLVGCGLALGLGRWRARRIDRHGRRRRGRRGRRRRGHRGWMCGCVGVGGCWWWKEAAKDERRRWKAPSLLCCVFEEIASPKPPRALSQCAIDQSVNICATQPWRRVAFGLTVSLLRRRRYYYYFFFSFFLWERVNPNLGKA